MLFVSILVNLLFLIMIASFPLSLKLIKNNRLYRLYATSTSSSITAAGHVYYIATPIGNLGDMTSRSLDILKDVDVVLAEDTRKTINLLRAFNLPQKRILAHHQYNTNDLISSTKSS